MQEQDNEGGVVNTDIPNVPSSFSRRKTLRRRTLDTAHFWKEAGKGGFIPMDIGHFPFLSLNTCFPTTAPSPIPAADIGFLLPCVALQAQPYLYTRAGKARTPLAGNRVQESPRYGLPWSQSSPWAGSVSVQAGTCSSSALPSPYLGSSALAKTGGFLPKRKRQLEMGQADLQFSLCLSRHSQKKGD